MEQGEIQKIIRKLLAEVEEEDIGISLFHLHCSSPDELSFFPEKDREHIVKILRRLSEDSHRHKKFLSEIVDHLGSKINEK